MAQKIDPGKTNHSDLYKVLDYSSYDDLESKKARLFPSGHTDNEIQTVSIFLASLAAVKEYREELISFLGVKKVKHKNVAVHTYTELRNPKNGERPDGLIVITSGKHNPIIEWVCFVEAKLKGEVLCAEQISRYAEFGIELGIKNIITISNQLVTNPFDCPVTINRRSINLYHWSWTYLKIIATHLIRTNAVADEDHIYILKELRRYFDNHKRLGNYINMGEKWKEAVSTLHSYRADQKLEAGLKSDIITSYTQEEKDISLQLTDTSGLYIELLNKGNRKEEIEKTLDNEKIIRSSYFINGDKKNAFCIEVDFIRREIRCIAHAEVHKGKAQAQTSSLVKMFEDNSGHAEQILINAYYPRKRSLKNDISLAELSDQKKKGEFYKILDKQFGEEVKSFEIKTKDLLGKDFISVKSFIVKLEAIAYRFLKQVVVYRKLS